MVDSDPVGTGVDAGRHRRWWNAPRVQASLVFAVSLGALLQYGLFEYPILEDRAYLIYLGQSILRGESIYAGSYMAYPPTGPLASAAAMAVGRWFGLPTYLSPRFAGVVVGALSSLLLYCVVRRATRSGWAGILAGLTLAGFSQLARLCVSNLEPKALVVLFATASFAALQRRRWFAAGLCAGLAATCWQPAALYALSALAVTARASRRRPWAGLSRLAAGGVAALLPTLGYLAASRGWWDFWQRAFVIPASMRGTGLAAGAWSWLGIVRFAAASEIVFFGVAAAGVLWFALHSAQRGLLSLPVWLHPSLGGVPLATLLWIGFSCRDFGGPPDMLPLLPLVAFWTGWSAHRLVAAGHRWLRRSGRPAAARRFAKVSVGALLVATPVYAYADAFLYRPLITLPDLERLAAQIAAYAGRDGGIASFDASELYVLTERPAPQRFLSLNLYADPVAFERFIPLAEPAGCDAVIRRLLESRTAVVAVKHWKRESRCVKRLQRQLTRRGYTETRIQLPERRHGSFGPDARYVRVVRWSVYWRQGAPALRPAPGSVPG